MKGKVIFNINKPKEQPSDVKVIVSDEKLRELQKVKWIDKDEVKPVDLPERGA